MMDSERIRVKRALWWRKNKVCEECIVMEKGKDLPRTMMVFHSPTCDGERVRYGRSGL